MNPKVSILLPTYNGEQFLAGAVSSVKRQSFKDWELFILDDGSKDKTPDIAKKLSAEDSRIHYHRNETNLGIQKTLNRGLSLAKGEYVARLDDDDEWIDEEKLHLQAFLLDAEPETVLVGTGTVVVDEVGQELFRFLNPQEDAAIRNVLPRKNCFTHSSVMFRKDIALELKGYPEGKEFLHVEDYDLWLQMGLKGKMENLPIYATRFRLRKKNISSQNKLEQLAKDIKLFKRYGKAYPRYASSLLFVYARYYAFRILPASLSYKALRWYKQL